VTISLRNLPPEIERAIVERSKREGVSLNQAAIQLLERAVPPDRINRDFDEFAGKWSAEEAEEFDRILQPARGIPKSLS
jgi:hypothetical protein